MSATTNRRTTCLIAAAVCVVLVSGCSGSSSPAAKATPRTSSSTPASPSASPSEVSGSMTGEELVWLEAITTLQAKLGGVLGKFPCCATKDMRTLAHELRGCASELAGLGPPSDRLQPVHAIVQKACAQYDKGAKCFDTAAKIGIPLAGSAGERKQTAAIHCGFSAPGTGSRLLVDALIKGEAVKAAASGSVGS
jgi:hypothetical protein